MRNDTICALATPAGGAIGVIRISGDCAISIADSVFTANNNKRNRGKLELNRVPALISQNSKFC